MMRQVRQILLYIINSMLTFLTLACVHQFLRDKFSPDTSLTVRTSLAEDASVKTGPRSALSSFEMTWTVLDLKRTPPCNRCCYVCNPGIASSYGASDNHDPRLRTFAADFLHPLTSVAPSRPSSSTSTRTDSSQLSTFVAMTTGVKISSEQKEALRKSLITFRKQLWEEHGSPSLFSSHMFLPPKQLEAFLQHCPKYLSNQNITSSFLQKLVKWDSGRESDFEKIVCIISDWRESIQPVVTPTSQRRARKKFRPPESPNRTPRQSQIPPQTLLSQPVFTPIPPRPRPLPHPSTQINDTTIFYSPTPSPVVPAPSLPVPALTTTPLTYNPYRYYHATPPSTSLNHNPYRYHLTTPLHHPPTATYQYPQYYQYAPLPYQTPVVHSRATQNPLSPVENTPPPPSDPNPSSSSST